MEIKPSVWTIGEILQWTKQYFSGKGVDNPRLDAEVLLSHILHRDRLYLYVHYDQPLAPDELIAFRECVRKRAARIPVAYITGEREFFGLMFTVSADVLVPRPETELLVEAVLKRLESRPAPRIVDLGTGSGAIAVSLLTQLPAATAVAIDISAAALVIAEENAKRHGLADRLELRQGDFWQPAAGMLFDAIVSNPPYIPADDVAALAPEVRTEPVLALDGGKDGLDYYRRLLTDGYSHLAPGGFMAIEIGISQADAIRSLAEQSPFVIQEILLDYAGIERVVVLTGRGRENVEN
ncbi:protein-(glutamine-N5) methyltransferase, release factor-specific [Anaerosporomusa subterranea]|uniref:Release factor glutamine methyltransferase n=1 Tax=Anaerosporomusa subterranea TaxID=1794912 RepID=A0A154BR64_ANASB|nr:peptide chain release factor N(5)-glutamine methyltransferase [Anaerosporomusa subterranea]KYZ76320.1 protein-(glutamine-N5) methyltransferase, release factor-specific [Anaerosporomusa subterranea]